MAEELEELTEEVEDEEVEVEVQVTVADIDDVGKAIQELYENAKQYRQPYEEVWDEAYSAYRAEYPSRIHKATELANERGIFVNLTRRKVNSARVKLGALLFDDGRIPFSITPSRKPRFYPQDVPRDLPPAELEDILAQRAFGMENRIRDILDKTGFLNAMLDSMFDLCLYGTGCVKSPVLKNLNFPVYKNAMGSDGMFSVESQIESELVPTTSYVSPWNLFPSPESTSVEDAEYIIQRTYMSRNDLLDLSEEDGFLPEVINECLEKGGDYNSVGTDSNHPVKDDEYHADEVKEFEVLEFWGKLNVDDLKGHIDMPENAQGYMDVCVWLIGDKVIKLAANPFDGKKPFAVSRWQRRPETFWGDGIYYAIRDVQALTNFAYAMMVEGKTLSATPMTVVNPSALEPGTDTETIYPGKQFKIRAGNAVTDAFSSVIIPDVTNGLGSMIQMLEREADLDSGQTAIGYGDQSPSQTRTATGMSILNSNANKQTADVVRSISDMLTSCISGMYHWLMVDSDENEIKGDYESVSTGWTQYVAKEIHNSQLLNFLQVIGNLPQLQNYINFESFTQPLVRAFNLDPEKVLKTEEQVQMEQQQAQQQQAQQATQAEELKLKALQTELGLRSQFERNKAILDEKKATSEDIRQSQIAERQILMNKGQVLNNPIPDYYSFSALLNEEKEMKAIEQQRQQQMLQQQQAMAAQQAQQQAMQAAQQSAMNQQQVAGLRRQASEMAEGVNEELAGGPTGRNLIDQQRTDPEAR